MGQQQFSTICQMGATAQLINPAAAEAELRNPVTKEPCL